MNEPSTKLKLVLLQVYNFKLNTQIGTEDTYCSSTGTPGTSLAEPGYRLTYYRYYSSRLSLEY